MRPPPLVSRSNSGRRVLVVLPSPPCRSRLAAESRPKATYTRDDARVLAGTATAAPDPAAIHLLRSALGGLRRSMAFHHRAPAGGHRRRFRRNLLSPARF